MFIFSHFCLARFVLPYSGAVRLYSTPSPASTAISPSNGFLELFLYGEWRLVCGGAGFDQSAAITTCRQLGYTSGFYNERYVVCICTCINVY